jgi:nitroreductase
MNNLILELLRKRRSVRKFQKKPIETEKIDVLMEAALRAPSSRGLNPWSFVFVDDNSTIEKLSRSKEHGSAFLAGCPLAIIVAADTSATDVWTEDCSIAATLLQLTAESLALGSCWVQIRLRKHNSQRSSNDYVKEIVDLPEIFSVECILGIGYPDEKLTGHPRSDLLFDRVNRNKYEKFNL